jgi:hypothetical protein
MTLSIAPVEPGNLLTQVHHFANDGYGGCGQAGLYSVVVSSAYGSATRRLASLTVVTPLVTSISRNTNRSMTFNFVGLPNSATRIWAATNLAAPILWQPISTNSNVGTSGTWQFTDTNAIGYPARYYRFSTP